MSNYKAMYYKLFAETVHALEEIEKRNYGIAEDILISAQQATEEMFLADDE